MTLAREVPDEPKKPRTITAIPRDRDHRVTKTPPAGVPSPVPREDWNDARASKTPVNSPDFATLMFRSGITKEHAMKASGEIAEIRKEFQAADAKLETRLDRFDGKLDEVDKKIDRQGDKLVDALTTTLQQHQQAATVTMTAKVRVEEAQQLDVIDSRKWRRNLVLKVLAIATPLVAAVATAITVAAQKGC